MRRAQKYADFRDYEHYVGRWWMLTGSLLLLAVPATICVVYDAWPPITDLLRGLLGVAPIYWTVGTIEVLTYVPMLGTGGSYLGFLTGNLTSLKVPCALNAMQACGMPNGEYSLGGQKVFMTDGLATLADGTIAGSATCQAEGFRRAVKFGVPLESALKAATINPARAAGLDDEVGSIAVGKRADVLVLGADLHPEHIFIGGKEL